MIKSISILIPILILLTACQTIYKSEDQSPFGPREYFRSIEMAPIGAAIMKDHKPLSSLEAIRKKIKNESAIKDVIILSRNDQTVVALKPFAYTRQDIEPLLTEYKEWFQAEGLAVVFLSEPDHFRKAKKMKTNDEVTSEEWTSSWGNYFEIE
ncbi:hypothetical protein [Guptibacillus hwajinpoensis]|uniref:hypothetical protein n=1 Tax=Guptibacillus hwajinpoensis TaxID=208199 RepID=UPI001CFE69B7|nr:hypothetical protein [Pseudalkalibacillus hwajinpoensis]WLR60617.1 hypothetical protein LC071_04475 [Pseudalkalibacillus hwajinpoensis]